MNDTICVLGLCFYSSKLRLTAKINAEYSNARTLPSALIAQQKGGVGAGPARPTASGPQRKLLEGQSSILGCFCVGFRRGRVTNSELMGDSFYVNLMK